VWDGPFSETSVQGVADCGARQSRSEPLLLLALFSTALAPWVIPTIIANANHEVAKSEAGAKRAVTLMDEIKSVETARRDWTSGVQPDLRAPPTDRKCELVAGIGVYRLTL